MGYTTRINPIIKEQASRELAKYDLTLSKFLRMMITNVANNDLPSEFESPNEAVMASLKEVVADIKGEK
ncbi:type II toxin-antitoxin system RelB/DinJ family antitoxin [Levilactobacillus andaensis]|uniref:type II toxin-antitoxin system RelB/DinJ family antitoxin n=1 Tax=Levilactobacillus andaensis TaxID=2799570 RepID=UPI001943EE6B|nr:type II toxin-antitoxin system RelB/DinJ family antitoxin [Levilactobacillus andaensis]